jgi:Protein of unknown function (DUF3309)
MSGFDQTSAPSRGNNLLVGFITVGNGCRNREESMLVPILIVLLVLFLVGALPTWNHSRSWGYFPSGGLGVVLVVVVVLLLLGRI